MEFIQNYKIMILILIFILLIIAYIMTDRRLEKFSNSNLCDKYLEDGIKKYKDASSRTKEQFLDWCNTIIRTRCDPPTPGMSMSMFHRMNHINKTFDAI